MKEEKSSTIQRKLAVEKAVSLLQQNDVVVLCGKGAENYIEINGKKLPYIEKEEIKKWGFKEL